MKSVAKRLASGVGKAVFCLFLMLATVTHALAEPVVFGETHAHAIETLSFLDVVVPSSGDADSRNKGGSNDSSFSHAAHDIAPSPREPDVAAFRLVVRPYASLVVRRQSASALNGPERPPRA